MSGTLAMRVAGAVARRGTPIMLRRFTETGSRPPLANPPILASPTVPNTLAGATSLTINAGAAQGRIVEGDVLTIDGQPYVVTAEAASRDPGAATPGFDAVAITPGLVEDVTGGTAIVPTWSADLKIMAVIGAYPSRLVDGTLIKLRDLMVTIAAVTPGGVAIPQPDESWQLIVGSDVRTIVRAEPAYAGGVIAKWVIQAR